jgi:hypothetical protein
MRAIRTRRWAPFFFLVAAALWVGASAWLTADEKPAGNDPAWKVTSPDRSKKPDSADNSYCLVCHINLEVEKLVDIHRPKGVGCETCHGLSDKHSADEDHLTAPEIMWTKEQINLRCQTCHARAELLKSKDGGDSHKEAFERWEKPAAAATATATAAEDDDESERYCTDCHGDHHITNRTRQWDKHTGKLLKRTGGPVMDR